MASYKVAPSPSEGKGNANLNIFVKCCKLNRVQVLRALIVFLLMATMVLGGYGSYRILYDYEQNLMNVQYDSAVKQLELSFSQRVLAKVQSLRSMSNFISMSCPDAVQWPNCSIPLDSYLNISDPIIELAVMRSIAFAPVITADQVASFEAFAYDFFEESGYDNMGMSSFGRGVSSVNSSCGCRFHDMDGYPDGEHPVLTPVLQIGNIATNGPAVMFNLYSQAYRVAAIDSTLNCFQNGGRMDACASITDIIHLVQDPVFRPAVLIIYPISPVNDPDILTGITYTVHNWDTVFSDVVPSHIAGIDIVLAGGDVAHTFKLERGKAKFSSTGDKHESAYDNTRRQFDLAYFQGAVLYTVTLYSTVEYYNKYHTNVPIYAMLATVSMVLLTAFIFGLFDFFMEKNVHQKEIVINTKRLFVRYISHEIRTPMNTVHLGLKVLMTEFRQLMDSGHFDGTQKSILDDKLTDWTALCQDIEESSDTAISVLNDLINYDKIAMGTLTTECTNVYIWGLIEGAVRPFMINAREKNVQLVLDMEYKQAGKNHEARQHMARLITRGDPVKLGQVIRNLVSNALKFSPPGKPVIITAVWVPDGLPGVSVLNLGKNSQIKTKKKLRLLSSDWTNTSSEEKRIDMELGGNVKTADKDALPRAGSMVLTIKDYGAGMNAEDQKLLFHEGIQFRANQLQAGQGSGLGLWISKGVVDVHGGTLTGYSPGEGLGSEFRCELPLLILPEGGDNDNLQSNESESLSRNHTIAPVDPMSYIKRILIVDDAAASRKVLARLLKQVGYEVEECVDGIDCLEKMEISFVSSEKPVDLILMDFEMPRLNGPNATQKLRDKNVKIPIIGLTGNVLEADVQFFRDHGADAVLPKPLTLRLLQDCIANLNANKGEVIRDDDISEEDDDNLSVEPPKSCHSGAAASIGSLKMSDFSENRLKSSISVTRTAGSTVIPQKSAENVLDAAVPLELQRKRSTAGTPIDMEIINCGSQSGLDKEDNSTDKSANAVATVSINTDAHDVAQMA